jgi:hypothetical protein
MVVRTCGSLHWTERGGGLVLTLIRLVGIVLFVGVLWQGLELAYRFYDLRTQTIFLLRSAEIAPDLEIKKKALSLIKGAGMTSNEQDIVLKRSGDRIRAEMPYRHDVAVVFAGKQITLASIPVRLVVEQQVD